MRRAVNCRFIDGAIYMFQWMNNEHDVVRLRLLLISFPLNWSPHNYIVLQLNGKNERVDGSRRQQTSYSSTAHSAQPAPPFPFWGMVQNYKYKFEFSYLYIIIAVRQCLPSSLYWRCIKNRGNFSCVLPTDQVMSRIIIMVKVHFDTRTKMFTCFLDLASFRRVKPLPVLLPVSDWSCSPYRTLNIMAGMLTQCISCTVNK